MLPRDGDGSAREKKAFVGTGVWWLDRSAKYKEHSI